MDHIDEHEQGERVRAWLKKNGSSLITGVALGLAALSGWNWWQAQGEVRKVEAAAEFLAFTRASEAGETAKAAAHAQALRQNHGETVYNALVALVDSRRLLDEGKGEESLAVLDGVAVEGLDASMAELLSLRAARVLVTLGRHEDALKRLEGRDFAAYAGVAAELRGDASLALGRREEAREAYEAALAALDLAAATRGMVELKFTEAGGRLPETPEA
ncbi:YfgM family protein [Arenimonas caeni]|jgi:predicted negative regulator of RcsB-dependent stress response|uniref:Ancillary SecYEG translocon subunit n=1 Tax=Arenimonas caeni TaxID=2058085 RepID=A0A2P6MAX8_9GAMM|nr:tetratricopeptide repeat protein [Arenimonas caeni]MDY0022271.1 tetratricopeptide repeat protein [Arenimonas caeni]PRH83146.1 hypothetical protein C6N40_02990 [Arenimonas caeni]